MATRKQLERRRGRALGASQVAAMLGLDPFQSGWDVYAYHVYGTETPVNYAMQLGTALEPLLLDYAEEQLGPLVREVEFELHDPSLIVHPDAVLVESGEVVEAKTADLLWPKVGGWGEPETGEVPVRVAAQVTVQMIATEAKVAWIPLLRRWQPPVMYCVEYDEEVASWMLEEIARWWRDHIVNREPPVDIRPSLETLRDIPRKPGTLATTVVPADLVTRWQKLTALRGRVDRAVKETQADILAVFGDADTARDTEDRILVYKEIQKRAYSVPASSYRKLQSLKGKAADEQKLLTAGRADLDGNGIANGD